MVKSHVGGVVFVFVFHYHLSVRNWSKTGDKDVGLDLSHILCKEEEQI